MNLCSKDFMDLYELISIFIKILKYLVPLIIIFLGVLDFYKSVVSSEDNRIKKSFFSLLRRIIAGVLIFLLPSIVLSVFDMIGINESMSSCIYKCVLNNECVSSESNVNSKDNVIGNDVDYSIYIN